MKKILSLVLAVAAVAGSASAYTQAEIDAMVAQFIASLGGTATTTTVSATTKTYTYSRLLKVGKRGEDVKELQTCLNRLGNNTGVADGIFGQNTKAGVMSFQAENGLAVDGIIGRQTGPKFEAACAITTTTTETTETEDGDVVTGDKLVVSGVAADDMIVGLDQTVVFAKLTLEAGDKDVDVKKVYVSYTGTADADVIDKVVLLDSAMLEIDSDSLDSDDEATLKADLTVRDGESTTVYLAAVTASAFSSDNLDGSLKVTSVSTDGADVEGDSVKGASHTFNDGVAVDDFNVEIENESGDVKIGEEDVKVATITVEAGEDAQTVKSFKLERTATASKAGDDDLDNVKIVVKGKTYKASQDDEEYTFDFGDGILLEEDGDDEDFVLYTDIEDGAGSKFRFDITDVVVTDEDGILLSKDAASVLSDTADEFTIELSEVTISKTTDTQSDKIAAGQEGVELASFEAEVTGKDVEGDVEITLLVDTSATDLKDVDLDNVAIYTADGDRVSDKEDTSFATKDETADAKDYNLDGDQLDAAVTFAVVKIDDVTFEAGDDAVDYVIKADVNEDAVDGTKYEVKQILYTSIEDKDGEDISDVTETIASPATIEVEGAVIEVSVEEADDTDLNTDTDDVEVAQIKFDAANSGDDVRVTKVKVSIVAGDTDLSGTDNDDLRNCELFDGNDSISDKEDAGASVTFDVDFIVKADEEKNISVKCDIGSDFTNTDTVTVTGVDFDAKGVNTDTDLDATITGNTVATVTTGAISLFISTDDENDDKVVRDTDDNVVLGVYEFKAKDAELTIDDVTFNFDTDVRTFIDGKVEIFIDGESEGKENLDSGTGDTVVFENLSKTVAKDQTVIIKFVADMDNAGTITPASGDSIELTTEEGIGSAVDGDNPVITVVSAIPVVTAVSDAQRDNVDDADDMVLFSYKVKAEGGDVLLKSTLLTAKLTNAKIEDARVEVYDNSSMSGSSKYETAVHLEEEDADKVFDESAINLVISDNDTYYVFLIADVVSDAGTIRVEMLDDPTGVVFATDVNDDGDFVDAGEELTGDKVMENDMKSRVDFKARD